MSRRGDAPVHVVVNQLARERALSELPEAKGIGKIVPVVHRNHHPVAGVGMSRGAVLIQQHGRGAGLEIDDPVVLPVQPIQVFQNHQPATALVQVALVECSLLGVIGKLRRVFTVDQASQHLRGVPVHQRGGMDPVVVAGVHLPDHLVAAVLRGDVVDRLELLGDHVVAQHPRPVVHVDLRGLGAAEVPPLGRGRPKRAPRAEERPDHRDRVGHLVVAE